MNKVHYVYMYVDPFKPYNNEVYGYNIEYTPYYIGKGIRNRYTDHISEALRYANKNIHKETKIRQIILEDITVIMIVILHFIKNILYINN